MKILRYLKVILIAGPVIVFYHLFYMCKYARHPEKYPFEKRYNKVRKEILYVFKCFKVDFSNLNIEEYNKTQGKCLMIINHYSNSDPLLLIAKSEKPITFVCKKEILKFPFVGKIAKALECFPLDRNNLMNQIGEIRNIVSYLKDENKPSVIIFIEGTRNKNPEKPCLEFHPGTLKIAQMANVPLLCGAIYGSFRILDKKSYLNKYPVFFNIFKRIGTDELKQYKTTELAPNLQHETDNVIVSFKALDKDYVYKLKNSKKRKALETRFDVSVNS